MMHWSFTLVCWNRYCKRTYKPEDINLSEGASKCTCGSYIIAPNGKAQISVIEGEGQ